MLRSKIGKTGGNVKKWSRQESNLDLKFRKLLFYPLNYGTSKYIKYVVDKVVSM